MIIKNKIKRWLFNRKLNRELKRFNAKVITLKTNALNELMYEIILIKEHKKDTLYVPLPQNNFDYAYINFVIDLVKKRLEN